MHQIKELPSEFYLSYKYFINNLLDKEKRPNVIFNDKSYFMYIDSETTSFGIEEIYLHLISIEGKKYKKIRYPCQKDTPVENCKMKCKIEHIDNILNCVTERRVQCINRAKQLKHIIKTIDLNNNNSPLVKMWEHDSYIFFRYQDFTKYIDYLVLFQYVKNEQNKKPYLRLVTAYPIFEKFIKEKFDEVYQNYIKKA